MRIDCDTCGVVYYPGSRRRDCPKCQSPLVRKRDKRRAKRQTPQLGDVVEKSLKFLGVTPERYVAFKAKFGAAPTCGCASRKRWLNDFSREFGGERVAWLLQWFGA